MALLLYMTTIVNETVSIIKPKDEKVSESDDFSEMMQNLDNMRKQIVGMLANMRQMQKKHQKKAKKNSNVKSGFVKPVRITKVLSDVIETDERELVARSVVNKKINEYIKRKGLQVIENRQTFKLDNALAVLFGLNEGDVVHYFKMQTYLKHHYPKEESKTVLVN